jgi:GTPase Era involved in 16S rRNA processing
MKTPKQLRREIHDLSTHLEQIQSGLLARSSIRVARIGKECKRTADVLGQLLGSQQIPSEYKVAVVGRFKAGKSFFVNELLNTPLASEGTLPETAAVTTFRHGADVQANIRFIDLATWQRLKAQHAENSNHVDAHRVLSWEGFATPRKTKEGEPDKVFDLAGIEREYVREGGHTFTLDLKADATKKATTEFRRKLKEFTSANSPLHCLVDKIDITAPADILDQGVLLIDTPGLDDTERFRVTLTESIVADVDAVLFLTKSGGSYGQSEKDFLLSLLRKGTVKQLIVVVTQIDETYEKVLAEAEDNDEDPEPIAVCIERERAKITREITDTLKDLGEDDSLLRYRELLGEVPIAFTSARLHRNWKDRRELPFVIQPSDPGGVDALKIKLLKLLSSESRLAMTAHNLVKGASANLLDLQRVLETKLKALQNTQNKEVAEHKLHTFRDEFGQASEGFARAVEQQINILTQRLTDQPLRDETLLGYIGLLAEQPLSTFESDDMGKHWKTRRYGGWGYMFGLQASVANLVFPKVQQLMGTRTELFAQYSARFEQALNKLSHESDRIAQRLELGANVPLDVSGKLKLVLDRSLQRAQEVIASEEQQVLKLLDDFVTDEVADRISERRKVVESIWDTGTTVRQNEQVRAFYREVKALLKDALLTYLKNSNQKFSDFLLSEAKAAPRDALDEVQVLFEQATDNILAATTEQLAGQKEAAEGLIADIKASLDGTFAMLQTVSSRHPVVVNPEPQLLTVEPANPLIKASTLAAPAQQAAALASEDWASHVQDHATTGLDRLQLKDGDTGWSYERLFEPKYFRSALRISLIDPYLSGSHQLRNLKEFLLHVMDVAKPKAIEVITSAAPTELADQQERMLDNVGSELFKNYGVSLTVRREAGLHDRHLRLDNGVLFKLGRGLDLYKPATGLAAHRPASRRVRATEIDVFAISDYAALDTPPERETATFSTQQA